MKSFSKRISSIELQKQKIGSNVLIAGFVERVKLLGKMAFLSVRDSNGYIQIVINDSQNLKKISKLTRESVVSIEGKVKNSKAKGGGKELELTEIDILSIAKTPLPIEFMGKGIETDLSKRLDFRYIDLRNPKNLAIFRVRSKITSAIHEFFEKNNFIEMHTSKLSGAGAEGGAELFELPYFGKTVALNQSQQLYKQLIMLSGFEKAYEIGTSYRAEKSHTYRHLTEFWQLDVEMSFIDGIEDIMKLEERLLVHILKKIKKDCKKELDLLGTTIEIPKLPFPRITYADACKLLKIPETKDIGTELERKLGHLIKKKHNTEAFFLINFPNKHTKFYAMHDKKIGRYIDLIYKNNEISSGGQREHRYDILIEQIKERNLNPKELEFYTEPFKYGVPPHGGFGMGIDRLTAFILNLSNIRERVLFPRDGDRIGP